MFTVMWTIVKPFVTANWKAILIVVAIIAVLGCTAYLGYAYRGQKATIDTLKTANQQLEKSNQTLTQQLASSEKIQAARESAETDIQAADASYIQGVQDGKKQLSGAITNLHATISMRNKELADTKHKLSVAGLPEPAFTTGEYDGASFTDFLSAYGEDTLRLGQEADEVTEQLGLCQQYVSSIQQYIQRAKVIFQQSQNQK